MNRRFSFNFVRLGGFSLALSPGTMTQDNSLSHDIYRSKDGSECLRDVLNLFAGLGASCNVL